MSNAYRPDEAPAEVAALDDQPDTVNLCTAHRMSFPAARSSRDAHRDRWSSTRYPCALEVWRVRVWTDPRGPQRLV